MDISNIEYVALKGEEHGFPMTYRCIVEPKHLEALFSHRVGVFWPYSQINNGLPDEHTNEEQNTFEDALDILEEEDQGILSLVVFGNGRKEWHWHVKDIETWINRLNEVLSTHQNYPIQIEHVENDNWKYHRAFRNWANLA